MDQPYYLVHLTSLTDEERDAVRIVNQNLTGRKNLVSIAVGRVLGALNALPTEEVDSIKEYFKMNVSIDVKNSISIIREYCDIDPNATYDYAEKFYALRYELIRPGKDIYCISPDTVVEAALGITNVIDNDTIRTMREEPVEFCRIHNAMRKFLYARQLKAKENE